MSARDCAGAPPGATLIRPILTSGLGACVQAAEEAVRRMMAPLKHVRGLEFAADVGYVEFLSRVNRVEEEARRNGSWDAPHPWLNLFVSARDIADFDRAVIKGMLADGIDGPMLIYPMLKSK